MVKPIAVTLLENPLFNALIQLKGKDSGREFARKLQVEARYWEQIYYGRRPLGITLLKAITKTYPQLDGYVLAYLKGTPVPTELTHKQESPVIELSVGPTLGSSKLKIKHNVKCPACGHIYKCKYGNNNCNGPPNCNGVPGKG